MNRQQLMERLGHIEKLDATPRALVYSLVVGYVDFLLDSKGVYLAGPLPQPTSSTATYTAFDCPRCGGRVHATFT